MANRNEGSTSALGDAQAPKPAQAPPGDTLKNVSDRTILATPLYHGIRREELSGLKVRDIQSRQGVMHFRVRGKRGKVRFVPVDAMMRRLIEEDLALAGHADDTAGPVFRPVTDKRTKELEKPLNANSIYRNTILKYRFETGGQRRGERALRAFLARHSSHQRPLPEADIAKVQDGSVTPTFPPRASMIAGKCAQRTARRLG